MLITKIPSGVQSPDISLLHVTSLPPLSLPRFSLAEIKRIYRGFKTECPTGDALYAAMNCRQTCKTTILFSTTKFWAFICLPQKDANIEENKETKKNCQGLTKIFKKNAKFVWKPCQIAQIHIMTKTALTFA